MADKTFPQGINIGEGASQIGLTSIGGSLAPTLSIGGKLLATSAGPHVIGTTVETNTQYVLGGNFTGVGGTTLTKLRIRGSLTAVATETTRLAYLLVDNDGIITPDVTGTFTDVVTVFLQEPNITKGATDTITNASTLKIGAAPTEGTNNYALWVDAGVTRLDDPIALGGGAAPTLGTIGGSGPAVAAQNQWLRININGIANFIPVWQ